MRNNRGEDLKGLVMMMMMMMMMMMICLAEFGEADEPGAEEDGRH